VMPEFYTRLLAPDMRICFGMNPPGAASLHSNIRTGVLFRIKEKGLIEWEMSHLFSVRILMKLT
jgi:hypothetical protein